jgi:tRNA uridine 5-carboxymethylaminomethyl modification enzyme
LIHIGENNSVAVELEKEIVQVRQLIDLGLESGRMKTGTPPRVDGRSLGLF